jgi:hypothetical protein
MQGNSFNNITIKYGGNHMELCADAKKFLAIDDFINEHYQELDREQFEYLVNILEQLKDRVIGE